jgi:hypothetical protein
MERDILPCMNYRRGLQRLYAVLTVAWVAAILLVVAPSPRFREWQSGGWSNTYDFTGNSDPPTEVYLHKVRLLSWQGWLLAIGMALIPPLTGYWLSFTVSRWVYRGFRPPTKN